MMQQWESLPFTRLLRRSGQGVQIGLAVGCVMLAGCASRPTVQANPRLMIVPEFYTVQRGDTLGGIAARFGLDYRDVGQINQVDSNYTIYADQRLRLRSQGNDRRIRVLTPDGATHTQPPLSTQRLPAPVVRIVPPMPVAVPVLTAQPAVASVSSTQQVWFWPVDQPVVEEYNLAAQIKGLRFSGQIGDSIRAAADGAVVYADDGLKEYGKLVLIKHLNGYISAYAHNSRLLVRENDRVKAGQIIAEMGNSGTDRVMLEFQVRLNGKPVDPRGVLSPSR
jgi:lipoprotein NlpD